MFRSKKNIYIVLIITILFGVSVGYAVLNKTLNITGYSEVKENTWDLHFKNVMITSGSVEATNDPTIDNTNLSVNFDFFLNLPGDFYEFTVDIVNKGSIDAMVESISKTPALTSEQSKYMNYIIEYHNGEQIGNKQLLKSGSFTRIKVRVEYRSDVLETDMPTTNETLNLGFTVNYVQSDNTSITVPNNGMETVYTNGDINEIGTVVTIGTESFYTIGTEGDNVELLAMYNLYVGSNYECVQDAEGNYNCEIVEIENPTGMQSELAKGYIENDSLNIGMLDFGGWEYGDSAVKPYVDNYKIKLEEFGIDVKSASIPSGWDLSSGDLSACDMYNGDCSDEYPWIYSTSYWVLPGDGYGNPMLMGVYSDGYLSHGPMDDSLYFGIRPVIVISKSYFE